MDNEKKIEIPFGAFDSELIRQEINIPNGFKAVIDGNKIILTRIESEDEKVRKALAEMVHDTTGDELWVDYNVHKEEALAWLEKQSEQKSSDEILKIRQEVYQSGYNDEYKHGCEDTKKQDEQKSQRMISAEEKEAMYDKPGDKVEPKFKVGQWYQCTKDFFGKGVTFDKNTAYYCAKEGCLQDEYGCHIAIVKDLYDNFKLWNIEDAKDGFEEKLKDLYWFIRKFD